MNNRLILTRNTTHIQRVFGQSDSGRWWSNLVIVHCVHMQLYNIFPLYY